MRAASAAERAAVEGWVCGIGFSQRLPHRRHHAALVVNVGSADRANKALRALLIRQNYIGLLHPSSGVDLAMVWGDG